jgi:hypothetical protein
MVIFVIIFLLELNIEKIAPMEQKLKSIANHAKSKFDV